jgi:Domain of unknown function (DUF317)
MPITADGAPAAADDPARPPEPATAGPSPHPAGPDPDADGPVQVTPRALAGPGEPGTALEVLREAGWQVQDDDLANAHAWSPDALVYVGFLPEGKAGRQHAGAGAVAAQTLWEVRAYRRPNVPSPVWTATFDDLTPAELVAAFLAAAADPAGITRDPLDPAGMLDDPADNPPPDTTTSP